MIPTPSAKAAPVTPASVGSIAPTITPVKLEPPEEPDPEHLQDGGTSPRAPAAAGDAE